MCLNMIILDQSKTIESDTLIVEEPVLTQPNETNMSDGASENAIEQQTEANNTLKRKSVDNNEESLCDNIENSQNRTQIDKNDLEELFRVYKKCKKVIKKIETKYGHLLNLNEGDSENTDEGTEINTRNQCNCVLPTKIIFDESGNEIVQNNLIPEHICVNKLDQNKRYDDEWVDANDHKNISIEFEMKDLLPNDIQTLHKMLKNANLSNVYRNKITRKIKIIQYERRNELKFQRPYLISQLKSNPKALFNFKGSNLFELPGYIVIK